jgi:hypothetical protein
MLTDAAECVDDGTAVSAQVHLRKTGNPRYFEPGTRFLPEPEPPHQAARAHAPAQVAEAARADMQCLQSLLKAETT